MSIFKFLIGGLTLLTVTGTSIYGQTTAEQTVKMKFKSYIAPRLDGRQLKTNVLQGDLNGDNQVDIVIDYCVQATDEDRDVGGGNALMNLACMEEGIAIYLKQGADYVLSVDKTKDRFKESSDISIDMVKIEGKAIVCETTGYKDDDARCCPSLKRTVFLVLNNGKLEKSTTIKQQELQDWKGIYSYKIAGPVVYNLFVQKDNSCVYEGVGIQTFFKVSCRSRQIGNKFEIYFVKTLDGAFYPEDWIDKSKPILTLFYKDNKLYTDKGQLDKEIKGGQLLFLKTE